MSKNGKKLIVEFFSEDRIALNREVREHPELCKFLAAYEPDDFPGMIGEIAAYCLIGMDGMYTPESLDKLCGILFHKLRAKRCTVIMPSSAAEALLDPLMDKLEKDPSTDNLLH